MTTPGDAEPKPAAGPPSLHIRRATTADVPSILHIDHQVYPSPWSEAMLLQQILGDDRVHIVAVRNDTMVGHGGILFLAGEGHISTLAVDPAARRASIGRNLLVVLFHAALVHRCIAVTLEVRSDNAAALALYRGFGLAPAGIRRGYYAETGDDALVLWSPDLTAEYADRIGAMHTDAHVTVADDLRTIGSTR